MAPITPKLDRRLSFRCDQRMINAVDAVRGDIPRERWLRRAIEQTLLNGPTIIYPQSQPPKPSKEKKR